MLTDLLWGFVWCSEELYDFVLLIHLRYHFARRFCLRLLYFFVGLEKPLALSTHELFMYTSVMSLWLDISVFSQSFNILLMKYCRQYYAIIGRLGY